MNIKSILLATVSGFVVMFFLAWLGHMFLISSIYEASVMADIERETPLVQGIAAAYLVIALLMAYIYPRWAEGHNVLGNGIRFGILVGLLISLPISLILYSTVVAPFSMVLLETAWHMIEEGAGGIAIAYAYRMKVAAAPAAKPV